MQIARDFAPDPQFALIRFGSGFANAEILAVGTEPSVMALYAETPVGGRVFHSVRPVEHELTVAAVQQTIARLTANQRQALADLETDRRTYGRREVRPGYESGYRNPQRWNGMDSVALASITQSPKLAKMVRRSGVPYGPKTYSLTRLGRLLAAWILDD